MARTRLAPSPTGALHLGNARTFALTWLWARAHQAGLPLRIEDIDSPRKKVWAVQQALDDLRWLGLDWDGPPLLQTSRHDAHVAALEALIDDGHVYACACSRKDVVAAQSAPHADEELTYPGTCRDRFDGPEAAFAEANRPVAWRFRAPPGLLSFEDGFRGPVSIDPSASGGDFVVGRWSPDEGHQPGYQVAVVVDDAFQHVDTVIRGDDLLTSAARQMLVQRALGLAEPGYVHVPLVVGHDGRRLAKRHGDTRIASFRQAGRSAAGIRDWIARTSGFQASAFDEPEGSLFTWNVLPRERVVVTDPEAL